MKRIKELAFNGIVNTFGTLHSVKKVFPRKKGKKKFSFIAEEFFHEDLRGFGGYGMTVKNITDQFYAHKNGVTSEVLMTTMLDGQDIGIRHYHHANVVFRPPHTNRYVLNFLKYGLVSNGRNTDFLLSIDWYKSYEYAALALPKTPLVIWIKDPRGRKEWERIASVPLELKVSGDDYSVEKLNDILNRKKNSVHRILELSKKHNRRVIFAVQAHCLVEKAKRSYGLDEIETVFLPNIVDIPDIKEPQFSEKPSVCFLGRLEPVKRPAVFCALAERFPHVDFLVAGKAHFPEIMNVELNKYKHLKNLKFLGLVQGEKKVKLLNSAWAFVNTSVHEALPVSFLEALAYGKPIISCQDPDEIVTRFGYATGEVLGEGTDEQSLKKYSDAIEQFLSNDEERLKKGMDGRKFVTDNYSFPKFQEVVRKDILEQIK